MGSPAAGLVRLDLFEGPAHAGGVAFAAEHHQVLAGDRGREPAARGRDGRPSCPEPCDGIVLFEGVEDPAMPPIRPPTA